MADRHCSPASEDYYIARAELLEAAENSGATLRRARSSLESAITHAGICGCGEMKAGLEALRDVAGDEDTAASERIDQILSARERIDQLLFDCHH